MKPNNHGYTSQTMKTVFSVRHMMVEAFWREISILLKVFSKINFSLKLREATVQLSLNWQDIANFWTSLKVQMSKLTSALVGAEESWG